MPEMLDPASMTTMIAGSTASFRYQCKPKERDGINEHEAEIDITNDVAFAVRVIALQSPTDPANTPSSP